MTFKLIHLAIPMFALLIAAENYFAVRHEATNDRKDTRTNIALGLGSIVFGVVSGCCLRLFITEFTKISRSSGSR